MRSFFFEKKIFNYIIVRFFLFSVVHQSDYEPLKTIVNKVIKEKQPFVRLVISKENLLEMFKHNQYKVHLIKSKIPDGTSTTVYRCGPLIDLCMGPHVPHTGKIKAFDITKVCDFTLNCYVLTFNK